MERAITIENVGPIEKLSIPLPESGVVVLRGRNGVGKSHALAAVDSLVSGRGRPPCRDGASRGVVEGFGARLTLGRSTRRVGEAEVLTLEGRLDISQLVDPGLKDDEAADRTRIKALIQLSGQSADVEGFRCIIPDGLSLEELLPAGERSTDPVTLAGQLKRALEAEARRYERILQQKVAEEDVLRQQQEECSGVAVSQDDLRLLARDPERARREAEKELSEALVRLKELQTHQQHALERLEQIAAARKLLAELESQGLPDVAAVDREIAELDEKISKLEQALLVARERRQQAIKRREEVQKMQRQLADIRQFLQEAPQLVPDEAMQAAEVRVAAARERLEAVITAARFVQISRQREALHQAVREADAQASRLREAAASIDDVLSQLVGRVTSRLRVEAGRLVCDTDRGVEPFGELSPGERWRIALEIAAEQVGRGGLVTVPQEAWEALDPVNRQEIARIAHEVGVVILTAEADAHAMIETEVL